MTNAQRKTITEIFNWHNSISKSEPPAESLESFINSACPIIGTNDDQGRPAYAVEAYGQMIGVEPDGYSHT